MGLSGATRLIFGCRTLTVGTAKAEQNVLVEHNTNTNYLWDTSVEKSSGKKMELLASSPIGQNISLLIRRTSVQILCVGGWELDAIS